MKRIRPVALPRFTYTVIFCALIVSATGISQGIAADNDAKVTLVYEHALPNVPGKSIKGCVGRIRSRRFLASPHACKVSFHLCDRSRGSNPKFG